MAAALKKAANLRQSEISRMAELFSIAKEAETNDQQYVALKVRYKQIDQIRQEFLKQHNTIIGALDDDDQFKTNDQIRKDFENSFWAVKSIFFNLFSSETTEPGSCTSNTSQTPQYQQHQVTSNLKPLDVPIFSGDITNFPSFKDRFDALVHKSSFFSDVTKFEYLLKSLEDQPKQLVQHLPLTEANYHIAYDTLVKRYFKPRIIAANHWAAIENTKKVSSDNGQELRNLLDTFNENLEALRNLLLPVDAYSFPLVQMMLKRLDISLATKFELQLPDATKMPDYKDLVQYLERHCQALDNVELTRKEERKVIKKPGISNISQKSNFSKQTHSFFANNQSNNNSEIKNSCLVCKKGSHTIFKCKTFMSKQPNERYQLAKNCHLCLNCLSYSHSIKECPSVHSCMKCGMRHHSYLHFESNRIPPTQNYTDQSSGNSSKFNPGSNNNFRRHQGSYTHQIGENNSQVANTFSQFSNPNFRLAPSDSFNQYHTDSSNNSNSPHQCHTGSGSNGQMPSSSSNRSSQGVTSYPNTNQGINQSNLVNSHQLPIQNNQLGQLQTSNPNFTGLSTPFPQCFNRTTQSADVLLSTALVEILDSTGNYQVIRILVDCGSQSNFITKHCARRLGLQSFKLSLEVQGINQIPMLSSSEGISSKIRPIGKISPLIDFNAIIIPKICGKLPSYNLSTSQWPHIQNCQLADPEFYKSKSIDALVGADIFAQILRDGRLVGGLNEPVAINSVFGFLLMGKISAIGSQISQSFSQTFLTMNSLEETVEKFWKVEEVPKVSVKSPEDELADKIFSETTYRDESGRFVVSLPFRSDEPTFPNSRNLALKHFLALERRLLRNPDLHKQYSEFMDEYLSLGHMQRVSSADIPEKSYYIPHHCVLKPSSVTTKCRVVYNASAKAVGDPYSLNDCLLPGPKLQADICQLLLLFRLGRYVFTADICKMFRQILINPNQIDYQRILWRFTPDGPIEDLALRTVTYGLTCSPYLAIKSLLTLAELEKSNYPEAADLILSHSYVDDVSGMHPTIEGAKRLQKDLIALLAKGGFELRKWCSNDPSLLTDFPTSHLCNENLSFDLDSNESTKVLGLEWNPSSDCYQFSISSVASPCTKRTLLSNLAKIFDPLGILTPVTFYLKHLIQKLWDLKLDWDDLPPVEIQRIWEKFTCEISSLSWCTLPRRIVPDSFQSCQIHGFSDASERGYCAIVYARFECNGSYIVKFIAAKSKVAPLKTISIARLELCGAVLLARLLHYVCEIYSPKLSIDQIFAWSDSTITLSWIKSSPHRLNTFVANRVSFVQEKIPSSQWHHVLSLF